MVAPPRHAKVKKGMKKRAATSRTSMKTRVRKITKRRPRSVPKNFQKKKIQEYVKTGIEGLDQLLDKGIPRGSSVIIAGGAGSGKTIMCLQTIYNAAKDGKKVLYMSFEETEERLLDHMKAFGWDVAKLPNRKDFVVKMCSIYDITRLLEAMMAKAEGDLMIDINPIMIPKGFKPDIVVIDSVTAIASAFQGKDTYRSYIENLFRYLQREGVTSFMITETEEVPTVFSPTGVEEFLADGVIVLYSLRKGDIRQNAIEVLKLRGASHMKKVVAMRVVSGVGIEVYPEQEVFGDIK